MKGPQVLAIEYGTQGLEMTLPTGSTQMFWVPTINRQGILVAGPPCETEGQAQQLARQMSQWTGALEAVRRGEPCSFRDFPFRGRATEN